MIFVKYIVSRFTQLSTEFLICEFLSSLNEKYTASGDLFGYVMEF